MKNLTCLLLILASTTMSYAQHSNFNTQDNWSLNKKEVMIGFGGTQFLGDLGGRDQIGTDFSLVDLDWPATSLGGMIGYRYRWHPYWATTSSINIGMVRGNDALTSEIIRESRNLHFRSMIFEFHQRLECIILANEKIGNRYNLRGHGKKMKDHNEQFYLFAGIGVNYFNPKALYNGSWTALRPMSTEGQGLPGGPAKYLPVTATIPMGFGMRMGLSRMWRIGLEATYVKTFSDYIDDVSGSYFDRDILATQVSPEAAYLANPSVKNTTWFADGQQRGDENKDAYFYVNITIARNITYKNYSKRRKELQWRRQYKF